MGNSVCFPRGNQLRQSCATQPRVHVMCISVSIIHRTGSLTCAQMLMREIAQGGCTDSVRESALLTLEEKSLVAPGNGTCVNGVPVRRSVK